MNFRFFFPTFIILFTFSCSNEPVPEIPPEEPAPPEQVSVPREEALYRQNGCESCHGKYGAGDGGRNFPSGIPDLRDISQYKYGYSKNKLKKTLLEGIEGTDMRGYSHLQEEELDRIIDYVLQLQKLL